jgi:hypothetical protein
LNIQQGKIMVKTKSRPKRAGKRAGYVGPKQTIRDPRSGVEVALYGDDKGTPELLRQICRQLQEFMPDGVLPFPLRTVATAIDGRFGTANLRKDCIDILHENGTLGDIEYATAQLLQASFDLAHDYRIGSVGIERTGCGQTDPHEMATMLAKRSNRARAKYRAMMGVVGGENSMAGLTMLWVICRRQSLSWMEDNYGRSRRHWGGVLQCALETVGRSRSH